MKLLIAIPALDYIHVDFMDCLVKLVARLKDDGVDFEVKILSGTLVYAARDKLVHHAIDGNFTHVLWLDADMIFNDDLLEDLMFSGKKFVTAICHARRKPYMPCFFKSLHPVDRYEEYPSGVFEIAGCGMACCLMTIDVLFDVQMKYGTCFCPGKELGEDLAFCDRARYLNHHIYADSSVVVGHIGHFTVYPETHREYMAKLGVEEC
jgi:hypothetical protein